jgi:hypothetical protein
MRHDTARGGHMRAWRGCDASPAQRRFGDRAAMGGQWPCGSQERIGGLLPIRSGAAHPRCEDGALVGRSSRLLSVRFSFAVGSLTSTGKVRRLRHENSDRRCWSKSNYGPAYNLEGSTTDVGDKKARRAAQRGTEGRSHAAL